MTNKLSLTEKMSYGLGDFACNIIQGITLLEVIKLGQESLGLSLFAATLIIFLSRFFDIVTDLIIGRWLDKKPHLIKTFMKVGIPAIIVSALGLAVFRENLVGYIIFYNLLNSIAYDVFNIAYGALNLQMTSDDNERAKLTGWRMSLSIIGILAVNIFGSKLKAAVGWSWYFVILAAVFGIAAFISVIGTKNHEVVKTEEMNGSLATYIIELLKTPLFYFVLLNFIIISLKRDFTLYYYSLNNPMTIVFFMVPSIFLTILWPYAFKYVDKTLLLALSYVLSFIQSVTLNNAILDGICFSVQATLIYQLFSDVNLKVFARSKINISALFFSITAITYNLSSGSAALLVNLDAPLKVSIVLTLLGIVTAVGIYFTKPKMLPSQS